VTTPDQLAAALADRYLIERELGAGGMATVYLALDVRHDRRVALKVLRPELAAILGGERFLAEIKTTANLQHPHILSLFDSGEASGLVYYVMPYVEGESLRDRLAREKQLPVEDAVRIAREVADALQYAHEHGIVHRDIKPENILLHGGHAMVADFGIALAASRSEGGTRMTETGMSLGTPHYMSPEQAMGEREITPKADIYALGCVLYEMLTAEPPFIGATAQAIIARVMTEEPRSLTLQRKSIPPHIEAAVEKALEKLPADRFASAAEFGAALGNATFAAGASAQMPRRTDARVRPSARLSVVPWLAAAGLGILGLLAGRWSAPKPPGRLIEMSVRAPDSVVGFGRCCGNALALAPDGSALVFVGARSSGGPLYRRLIGHSGAEPIPGTEGASVPFFSPDGHWLGYFLEGRLLKVPLSGGPPVPIASFESVNEASWGEGDVIVVGMRGQLVTVRASGGTPQPLTTPDSVTRHYAPSFLPGGKAVLFSIRGVGVGIEAGRIGVVDLATRTVDTVGPGTKAAYGSGYLVFAASDNTLLAQPFDPARRRITGSAVAILDGVTLHGGTTHEFAVSAAGSLVYQPEGASGGELLRIAGPGGRTTITLPERRNVNLEDPAYSPDGRRIVLRLVTGTGAVGSDLWMLDQRQGTLDRFTVGGGQTPVFSRDGRRVAYSKLEGGLFVKAADGTGSEQRIMPGTVTPGSWLADGRTLVFQMSGRPNTRGDIGTIAIGDSVPHWIVESEFRDRHPQLSPDGAWLAWDADRTGRFEVYVQPFRGAGPRVQVSNAGGESPRWSPDGRTLYYVVSGSIVAATRGAGPGFAVAGRRTVVDGGLTDLNATNVNWDIHPDGRQFLYIDQADAGGSGLIWILDWPELVRAMSTTP